jgi:hypothetical protein
MNGEISAFAALVEVAAWKTYLTGQSVSCKSVDDKLKMKFWSGLQDHIKEATGHLRNSSKTSMISELKQERLRMSILDHAINMTIPG